MVLDLRIDNAALVGREGRWAIATNNIQNLFTPFGDGNPLEICTHIAQTLQLGTTATASHEQCLAMATTRAAQATGIHNTSIAPLKAADLVIINARSASEATGAAPMGRTTIKQRRVVSETIVRNSLLM